MTNTYVPALASNTISPYVSSVINIPSLDKEEEYALFREYNEHGSNNAAKKLILSNLKLVVNLAYKFRRFRDVVDLIQEGNIGLLTALKKFDYEKGVRFATYATWWIKAKIQEFIISHMSIVRFGKTRDERMLFFNLVSTIKEIEHYEKDREIDSEELMQEVASRLDISVEKVRENMKLLSSHSDISLNQTYNNSDNKMIELHDDTADMDQEIIETDMHETIREAISTLNDREQYIISNRYLADSPMTLDEIGGIYDISKERVRQIEARALEKMRAFAPDEMSR